MLTKEALRKPSLQGAKLQMGLIKPQRRFEHHLLMNDDAMTKQDIREFDRTRICVSFPVRDTHGGLLLASDY